MVNTRDRTVNQRAVLCEVQEVKPQNPVKLPNFVDLQNLVDLRSRVITLVLITIRPANMMTPAPRRTAREVLKIVPLVMKTIAAELRAAGELPAPAHFGLLTLLSAQPRTLTELAVLQGVSLPTMSNSVAALVDRGWVKRLSQAHDRRVVIIEATPLGRATLDRVGRSAEVHLAQRLAPLDADSRRRILSGLNLLRRVFEDGPSASKHAGARTRPPGPVHAAPRGARP